MSFIVGLTGGIGSGKTTVANLFAGLGAGIVDTDVIAHELTAPQGLALSKIIEAFGPEMMAVDGSLNRTAMRRLCFSDPNARQNLECIIHPMIRKEALMRCRQASDVPYVLLVVPLLAESNAYREYINRILVVDCDEETRISRVMVRSGLNTEEVRAIMATQASREEQLEIADDIIANTTSLDELSAHVVALHGRYIELACAGCE